MSEPAFQITGHVYWPNGSDHNFTVHDTVSRDEITATVRFFADYARRVVSGEILNYYVNNAAGDPVWFEDPCPTMDLAIDQVRDDQRQSYPDMSAREAVKMARNTWCVSELDPSDAPSFEGYRKVLLATDVELEAIFASRS